MKGKVLSVRIREIDIASAEELCRLVGLPSHNMSSCVSKSLSLLLSNLRANGTLSEPTAEVTKKVIEKFSRGESEIGKSFDLTSLNLNITPASDSSHRVSRPIEASVSASKIPQRITSYPELQPDGSTHEEEYRVPQGESSTNQKHELNYSIQAAYAEEHQTQLAQEYLEQDLYAEVEPHAGIEEDIRLLQQLEQEELLSALLVTEHRGDDKDALLVDPTTMVKVFKEKEEEKKDE